MLHWIWSMMPEHRIWMIIFCIYLDNEIHWLSKVGAEIRKEKCNLQFKKLSKRKSCQRNRIYVDRCGKNNKLNRIPVNRFVGKKFPNKLFKHSVFWFIASAPTKPKVNFEKSFQALLPSYEVHNLYQFFHFFHKKGGSFRIERLKHYLFNAWSEKLINQNINGDISAFCANNLVGE